MELTAMETMSAWPSLMTLSATSCKAFDDELQFGGGFGHMRQVGRLLQYDGCSHLGNNC